MSARERYVCVEAPDTAAVVDFLGKPACSVRLAKEKINGRWHVVVTMTQNQGDGYQWTEQEHTFPCPVRRVRK